MNTVAVTGANGFLGSRASLFLKENFEVIDVTRAVLDITDKEAVLRYFDKTCPDYVIHSAAIPEIELVDQYPELADATNRLSAVYIANACKNIGAKMIFMSSDQVYSGTKAPHLLNEDVDIDPQNLYAKQKYAAENEIAEILSTAISLRLTWMYDTPKSTLYQHQALPAQLMKASKEGTTIKVNVNRPRSVTYIKNVIENLPLCLKLPGGVYNYGSENHLPIVEFYRQAACILGLSEDIIEPFDGNEMNISIDTTKVKSHGIIFPSAIDGFKEAFN